MSADVNYDVKTGRLVKDVDVKAINNSFLLTGCIATNRSFKKGDEIGKFQTPWAPVASHLADDELALALGLFHSLANLLDGVDILIIHFLQFSLGAGRH